MQNCYLIHCNTYHLFSSKNMEESEKSKPWEKPWTTEEIRKESVNWSLAGDAGLLNHLQQFSQSLLQKTHATEVSLDKLIEDLKTTSTEINNVTNSFLSLANTQFVENRVYDDDENEIPSENKEEKLVKTKSQQEAEVVAKIKEALAKGMALLESHFDPVEVPASDSEEEESSASTGRVILEARNPYMMRPLPYLIGSKEFMEDDHVGLGELHSDNEESPDHNLVQSSESEDEFMPAGTGAIPKRRRLSSSSMSENSEPESDRSGNLAKQKKHKLGNSHMGSVDALEEEPDMFGRESPPEADISQRGVRNSFAEELANKLGGVAAETSTMQKQEQSISDNLFAAPSDHDGDDSLFGPQGGKYSGGRGLFDDLDWHQSRNSLWENEEDSSTQRTKEKTPHTEGLFNAESSANLFSRTVDQTEDEDIFSSGASRNHKPASAKVIKIAPSDGVFDQGSLKDVAAPGKASSHGLFDEPESDSLFDSKIGSNKTGMPDIPKSTSLFDSTDMDDGDLFSIPTSSNKKDMNTVTNVLPQETPKKKIPAGAVNVFGNVDLLKSKLSPVVHQPSTESLESVSVDSHEPKLVPPDSSKTQDLNESQTNGLTGSTAGKISLFDGEEDNLFQHTTTSAQISAYTEDNNDSLFQRATDIVSKGLTIGILKPGAKDRKPMSLFDESDSGDDELLFSSTSSTSSRSRRSQGSGDLLAAEKKPLHKKGLFDDEHVLFAGQQDDPGFDIFSADSDVKNNVNSVSKHVPEVKNSADLFPDNIPKTSKTSHGLFDDFSGPNDDIFAIPIKTEDTLIQKADKSNETLKDHLFADNDDFDIFQVTVPPVNAPKTNEIASGVYCDNKNVNSMPSIIALNGENRKGTSLFDSLEDRKEENQAEKSNARSESVNNKPPIGQKPKVPLSKPSLFDSSEESDIFASLPNVTTTQTDIIKKAASKDGKNEIPSPPETRKKDVQETKSDQEIRTVAKPEPPRTLNIRKTTDLQFKDEDDLWTGSSEEKDNVPHSAINNETGIKQDTLSAILQDSTAVLKNVSSKPEDLVDGGVLSTKKQSRNVKETSPKPIPGSDSSMVTKTSPIKVSPLSANARKLAIDPTALLPGAKPPTKNVPSEGGVSFDSPVDTNAILHSAGKERAKIQVKRRPQSRRARQEAIRASSIDLEKDINVEKQGDIISKKESASNVSAFSNSVPILQEETGLLSKQPAATPTKPSSVVTSEKNSEKEISGPTNLANTIPEDISKHPSSDFLDGNSNPLSPSTDEEDFFAVPHDLPSEYLSTKDGATDERKNLFGGGPVLSPLGLSSQAETSNMSSDSLFRNIDEVPSIIQPKTDLFSVSEKTKSPLDVSSVDDDDDLFGSSIVPDNLTSGVQQIVSHKDLFSTVQLKPSSKINASDSRNRNLFHSVDDEPLFSAKNTKIRSSETTDDQSSLFPSTKNNSEDTKKTDINGGPVSTRTSENLFFSNGTEKLDDVNDIFSSTIQGRSSSPNVFSNTSEVTTTENSLFSPVPKNIIPKTNSDEVSEDGLFSSKSKSGATQRTSTTASTLTSSLFADDSPETDDLFASSVIASKRKISSEVLKESTNEKNSLFKESSDNLFGGTAVKSEPKQASSSALEINHNLGISNEEADLFSSSVGNKKTTAKLKPKPIPVLQGQKKDEDDLFEDPLMVMKK